MTMEKSVREILEMVRQGRISPEEGARLLEALGAGKSGRQASRESAGKARWLRIRVVKPEGEMADIRVPIAAWSRALEHLPKSAQAILEAFDPGGLDGLAGSIENMAAKGAGELIKVRSAEGAEVRIYVE